MITKTPGNFRNFPQFSALTQFFINFIPRRKLRQIVATSDVCNATVALQPQSAPSSSSTCFSPSKSINYLTSSAINNNRPIRSRSFWINSNLHSPKRYPRGDRSITRSLFLSRIISRCRESLWTRSSLWCKSRCRSSSISFHKIQIRSRNDSKTRMVRWE